MELEVVSELRRGWAKVKGLGFIASHLNTEIIAPFQKQN